MLKVERYQPQKIQSSHLKLRATTKSTPQARIEIRESCKYNNTIKIIGESRMYFFMVIKASGIVVGRVRKRRRPYTETIRPPLETLVNVKGQMNLKLLIMLFLF